MDIIKKVNDNIERGIPCVLATLVDTSGHTPRRPGAKMIVYRDGALEGTIGGGNFERIVVENALSLFTGYAKHLLESYDLEEAGPDSTGMICGGKAQVFLELYDAPDKLLIFGGGHVCRALTEVMAGLNFRTIVIDNRKEILAHYEPPVQTILADENYQADIPEIDRNCYIVIVTQGHKYDKDILAKVVTKEYAYIGMIGSKKKIARTYAALKSDGIDIKLLEKVHSPIGLSIGAEGPHEIAIAIAAEVISVKRHSEIL